jgi:hypothetical protein
VIQSQLQSVIIHGGPSPPSLALPKTLPISAAFVSQPNTFRFTPGKTPKVAPIVLVRSAFQKPEIKQIVEAVAPKPVNVLSTGAVLGFVLLRFYLRLSDA